MTRVSQGTMMLNKKRIRKQLYHQQLGKCCWCDKPMELEDATIEHIRARAVGGTDDIENLQVACETCNNERGKRLLQALQEERKRELAREAEENEKREYWRKRKLPKSKWKIKLPRGRKRVFDRYPPARYFRRNQVMDVNDDCN